MASLAPATQMRQTAGATGYAWYVALLLAGAHLLSFVDRFLMSLVMEPLKADLGVSDTQLGLLQGTGFVILYTFAAVPLGWLADSINRRRLIIVGIVLWSIATALCGLANSFGSLFIARIGVGFGEAALVPAAMSLLSVYFPRRQLGRAVSMFTTGASLGKGVALIGGGAILAWATARGGFALPLIGAVKPWQATFLIMGLPGFLLALLLLTVREPARAPAIAKPSVAAALSHVRSNRAVFATHVAASAVVVLLVQSLAAWAPSFYVRFLALSPAQAGYAVGTVALVASPLGHLCGGMLTDWFQARGARSPTAPVIVAGLLATIPCAVVFAIARSLPVSIAAYAAMSFCVTIASPATLAGLQMLTPDRLRGVVTSMFLAVTTFTGIGFGPPLIGFLSDHLFGGPLGLAHSILLVVPIFALAGVGLALLSRPHFAATANAAHGPEELTA